MAKLRESPPQRDKKPMHVNTVKMNGAGEIVISLESKTNGVLFTDRMTQLLPILEALAKSDKVMTSNENQMCDSKLKAVLAIEMVFSASLLKAESVAEQIGEVAIGNILASQIGFPEFDEGSDEGLAD